MNLPNNVSAIPDPSQRDETTGAEKLRVAFPSVMSEGMTREQEIRLVQWLMKRKDEVSQDMGRNEVIGDDWFTPSGVGSGVMNATGGALGAADTWMGKRCRWESVFNNDVRWRPFVYPSPNIFEESNLVAPISRRICRQLSARAQNYFFATDPWFAANAEGNMDVENANKIERYLRWKLEQIGTKRQLERALNKAFILGECVVKTTYVVKENIYQTTIEVLIGADGNPILDADGEVIPKSAAWFESETPGVFLLQKDQTTVHPEALLYGPHKITKRHVIFEGPEASPIYFKDFLCPLTANSVQDADFCAHLYDKPVAELVDLYSKRGVFTGSDADRYAAMQSAVAAVRQMLNNSPQAKSGAKQQVLTGEKTSTQNVNENPWGSDTAVAEIAECWAKFDVFEDGIERDVFAVIDVKNRIPLYYDFVENTTPNGTRPLDVVRINEVDSRWYGLGVMDMFDTTQIIIDLLVNRKNFSQSRAGRVDFFRASDTLEGENDPNLSMNWGGAYTVKEDRDPRGVLHSAYLNDIKSDELQGQIDYWMQLALAESGVTNANDAAAVGLDTAKLATGIRNIEKSGEELFAPFLSDLQPGLLSILNRCLSVLMANVNEAETFTYFERGVGIERTVTPEEIASLKLNVTLFLSKYQSQQVVEQMGLCAAKIVEFYSLPPHIQPYVVDQYRNLLRALDPKIDANSAINAMPVQIGMGMPGAGVSGAASGANGALPAPTTPPASATSPMPVPAAPFTPAGPA